MIEVSIIMPTMERQLVFSYTLTAVLTATENLPFPTEIIIVNDSKTSTPSLLPSQVPRVRLINNPGQGVASARNFGAEHAKGKFLLFIDDDMLVNSENLMRTYSLMSANHSCCYAANWNYPPALTERLRPKAFGRYLIKFGFVSLEGWENNAEWNPAAPFEVDSVAATYLPVLKKTFDAMGGFDKTYPFAGFEDYDFSIRLRKSGTKLLIDPLNTLFHNELDRVDIKKWMLRKRRSAQTRRVGVERGYSEAAVDQKGWKYVIYFLNRPFNRFWITLATLIPNFKIFDPLYFRLINFILGINLHIGYFHSKNNTGYL